MTAHGETPQGAADPRGVVETALLDAADAFDPWALKAWDGSPLFVRGRGVDGAMATGAVLGVKLFVEALIRSSAAAAGAAGDGPEGADMKREATDA